MSTENLKQPLPKPPLRFIEKQDLPLWRTWINNTTFSNVLDIKTPITPEWAKAWLEEIKGDERRTDFAFEKDGKIRAFGGFTGITIGTQTHESILGYQGVGVANIYIFVYPSVMNLGVGTDVVERLCSYCFKELGLSKIWLSVDSDDGVAIRAYEKCGFILTYAPPAKDYHGPVHYSLSRESWRKDHRFETSSQ